MAMSGIQYALASLQGQSTTSTTQTDNWATAGCSAFTSPADTEFEVADGSFRVQIVDACSLINVNTASAAIIATLPLTQEQADSLTDWRSGGEVAAVDGAKDSFYNSLPNPYNAKLGRLDSVDELLQVQYFTRDTIYDNPTTTTNTQLTTGTNGPQLPLVDLICVDSVSAPPSGGGKVAVNTVGGNTQQLAQNLQRLGLPLPLTTLIVQRRPFTSYGALMRLPGVTTQVAQVMLNSLSVSAATSAEGKLDLNTVTAPVLDAIPDMQADVVNAIITRQSTPFTGLGDLMTVPGITVAEAATFIDQMTVSSETFLIRSIGAIGNSRVALEATVRVTSTGPTIVKIVDEPFADMDQRWNWADVATTTSLVDSSQVNQQ
jgi:type II secretory pathway component PulK